MTFIIKIHTTIKHKCIMYLIDLNFGTQNGIVRVYLGKQLLSY